MRTRIGLLLAVFLVILPLATSVSMVKAEEPEPGITPTTVEALVFPGEGLEVGKTVQTPAIPPKPDIYFLADTTGSMGSVIETVKANASALLPAIAGATTDARFGAGDYKDFPHDGYAFYNAASVPAADDGGAAALAAISGWVAGGGYDGVEGQFYALDQIAKGVVNWRTDSTRIVVWFGDAPAHDPVCSAISGLPYDIEEGSLTTELVAAGVRVIAIGTTTGYLQALNDNPTSGASDYSGTCTINGTSGQADRIAAATGGVSFQDVAPENIVDAILEGLQNLPAEVEMKSNCAEPIYTAFAPDSQVVTSGDPASFVEEIGVMEGASGNTYRCQDWALVNDEELANGEGQRIEEEKTIHVPGITLAPATDTNELGFDLEHEVVATVAAGEYGPVEGVRVTFEIQGGPNFGLGAASFTNASGEVHFKYEPLVEPESLGTDILKGCFTDLSGEKVYGCGEVTKVWVDTTPPEPYCTPGVNPGGSEPNAPGQGGQGQNQDGFYLIGGVDVVWPADAVNVYVMDEGTGTLWGPFPVNTNIKYVEAPGAQPSIRPGQGAVDWMIKGQGDAMVFAEDGAGNSSEPVACLVPPPPMKAASGDNSSYLPLVHRSSE